MFFAVRFPEVSLKDSSARCGVEPQILIAGVAHRHLNHSQPSISGLFNSPAFICGHEIHALHSPCFKVCAHLFTPASGSNTNHASTLEPRELVALIILGFKSAILVPAEPHAHLFFFITYNRKVAALRQPRPSKLLLPLRSSRNALRRIRGF